MSIHIGSYAGYHDVLGHLKHAFSFYFRGRIRKIERSNGEHECQIGNEEKQLEVLRECKREVEMAVRISNSLEE